MSSLLSFLISFRFSYGRCRNSVIMSMPLISILSVGGIALGVTVLIVSLSIMNGFERELNQRILSVVPHGEIEPIKQPWENWNDSLKEIKKIPGIFAGAYIDFTGLVENGINLHIVQIRGIDLNQKESLGNLPSFVKNGAWKNFKSGEQQIIMGNSVVNFLKAKQGDWISITFSESGNDYKLHSIKRIRLHLTGILQTNGQLDHDFALIPIEDARKYLNINDSVTGIAIRVINIFNADKLVRAAGKVIKNRVHIRSWINNYGYIYRDIKMIRTMMYLSMILVIGVACFNIVSILMMSIRNRRKDIAILRTLGANNSLIRAIFIWYGFLFGLSGSLLGCIVGAFISMNLAEIINFFEQITGYQFLPNDVYFVNFIPSELQWLDVFCVLVITLLLTFLVSWYPSQQASHINPVDILRNN